MERYDYKVPEELIRNEDERKSVMEHIIFPIRVRVSNIIKYWLTRYPDSLLPLESGNPKLLHSNTDVKEGSDYVQVKRPNSNATSHASTDYDEYSEEENTLKETPYSAKTFLFLNKLKEKAASNLSSLIQKMLNSPSWMQYGVIKSSTSTRKSLPSALFSKQQSNSIDISQVDPLEIARQMCLIDEQIFRSIRTRELLGQRWTRENKIEISPNVVAMIAGFNTTVDIFSSHVISKKTAKGRAQLIRHFINVAKKLIYLGNYNSCHAIVSALSSTAIYRLRRSWDLVPKQLQADLQGLKNIFSPNDNYASLRSQLRNVNAPGVPWIGLYLRDLIIVEEAQKIVARNRSRQRKSVPLNVPILADGSSEFSKRHSVIIFSADDTTPELDAKSEISDGEGVIRLGEVAPSGTSERVSTLNRKRTTQDPSMIQFSKYRTMARILDELFKLRKETYNFETLPALQSILMEGRGIIHSPSTQFRMSIALEPLNTPSSDQLEEELEYFSGGEDLDTKSNKSADDIKPLVLPSVETFSSERDFDEVFISLNRENTEDTN
ncbi:RasGEF [Nowakowskiella sp. JEL0078]|nr:RasGEF [Nowakowskiella sp. JEL0078]